MITVTAVERIQEASAVGVNAREARSVKEMEGNLFRCHKHDLPLALLFLYELILITAPLMSDPEVCTLSVLTSLPL